MSKPPITDFDSATAMLRALARFLDGRDFPAIGQAGLLEHVVPAVNWLPRRGREWIYILGGGSEAVAHGRIASLDAEDVYRWAAQQYPARRYPLVFIGSSNGALTNICAALGAPWLPQTMLLALRQAAVHPDDPQHGLEHAREAGLRLVERNPDIQLHHMHDPNQDRLMLRLMAYFRIKRRRLGPAYEAFLDRALAPGGTIVLVECQESWPVTTVAERYYFQFGAVGGIAPGEYHHSGERVAANLADYCSHRRAWEPPPTDTVAPEAEWGFEPALGEDVARYARERGLRVVRLVFDETADLSPFAAELYRWWYRRRGLPDDRLLVQSFLLVEPYWTLKAGLIPFWLTFATDPLADALERYLDSVPPFDEIRMMLFSHGTEGVGLAPIERWRGLLGRARRVGEFLGVDEKRFPLDFATFARYHKALRALPSRYPVDARLTLAEIARLVAEQGDRFAVRWEGLAPEDEARLAAQ